VKSVFWRWQRRLPSPLTRDDLRAGYVYDLAFRQFEISDTRVFDRPAAGRSFFEQLIPGHLGEGGHIRSGTGIGGLCVAQTLVGGLANRPKGFPVLGGNPPADAEVAGVADHGFGAQRPVLLEILLDPADL